ncbi:hypothetical protein SDC9_207220 [bioreactor metagenome]|uniref:ABC transmembrane type-1 domain-containing protein n=2 Tax=root TaxID=1 RepID=A0A645J9U3_9ZZZZ
MQAMNPQGGPEYATLTMSQLLYQTAFQKGQFGYATAMGVALAAVTMVYALIIFIIFRLIKGHDTGVRRA